MNEPLYILYKTHNGAKRGYRSDIIAISDNVAIIQLYVNKKKIRDCYLDKLTDSGTIDTVLQSHGDTKWLKLYTETIVLTVEESIVLDNVIGEALDTAENLSLQLIKFCRMVGVRSSERNSIIDTIKILMNYSTEEDILTTKAIEEMANDLFYRNTKVVDIELDRLSSL